MMWDETMFLDEMQVMETAVSMGTGVDYASVCAELVDLLQQRLHISEVEAAQAVRLLVVQSVWRDERDVLAAQMARLEGEARCNGRVEERAYGIWYVRHGVGVCCPLHGEPVGKRLVVYVGKQPQKQAAVAQAMTQQAAYERLLHTWKEKGNQLARLNELLGDVSRQLDVV
jgi:hypothetical protein